MREKKFDRKLSLLAKSEFKNTERPVMQIYNQQIQ